MVDKSLITDDQLTTAIAALDKSREVMGLPRYNFDEMFRSVGNLIMTACKKSAESPGMIYHVCFNTMSGTFSEFVTRDKEWMPDKMYVGLVGILNYPLQYDKGIYNQLYDVAIRNLKMACLQATGQQFLKDDRVKKLFDVGN